VRAEEFEPEARPTSQFDKLVTGHSSARTRVLDARGRTVALADRALTKLVVRASDADHEHRMAAARMELRRIGRVPQLALTVFFAALGVIGVYLLLPIAAPIAVMLLVAIGLGVYEVWRGDFAFRPSEMRAVLLDQNLCPSCASSLRDLETAHDGCTVCPECGAAGRLPTPEPVP
jgi:hypothetical protein